MGYKDGSIPDTASNNPTTKLVKPSEKKDHGNNSDYNHGHLSLN